jgi:nicotinate-nucleotide adenylyltransferase
VGHVEVARCAKRHFGLPRLTVLVSANPGHKDVELDPEVRLRLARAAFPADDVRLDPHPRTIDLLRAERFADPLFVIGADEFCDFLTWKDPDGVIARARLAVATRPGYPRERLQTVLDRLSRPERVQFFEIEPLPISSKEIRERVARGESIDGLVPAAVAELIQARGLYRGR